MLEGIRNVHGIPGVGETQPVSRPTPSGRTAPGSAPRFDELLNTELEGTASLSFSAHAQSRLASRQIQLTPQQVSRLQGAVHQAAEKGARDSLVLVDNLAFIVSVANRTVVTAVDRAAQTGNVFTQIDSAVIV